MSCLLGYSNKINDATLSGGAWVAQLSITNLQTRILGQVARTVNAAPASSIINMDFGSAKNIQVVSLVNHNISLEGKIRITSSGDNWATTAYDSGLIDVWPAVYGFGDLEWEDDAWWSGTYTGEDLEGYTTNIAHVVSTLSVYRYWKIEILDSTNAAGYIQLGRVFIGSAWQPTRDAEVGLSLGWETATTMQKALSGTKYFQHRNPFRVTKFTLNVMDMDEALTKAFEIDKRMGIDGEVLWIQDKFDTIHSLRRRFLGTLREMSAIEFPYVGLGRKGYIVEESI